MSELEHDEDQEQKESAGKKIVKGIGRSGRILYKIFGSKFLIPVLIVIGLFLLVLIVVGTGIGAAESMGNFLEQLHPAAGVEGFAGEQFNQTATAEEILSLLDTSRPDEQYFTSIQIHEKDFRYLLQTVIDYQNEAQKKKTITVEGYYESTITTDGAETDDSGVFLKDKTTSVTQTGYKDKKIDVTNAEYASLNKMDWRLLYAYSLVNAMDEEYPLIAGKPNPSRHKSDGFIHKHHIDQAFSMLRLNYEYEFDVMTDERTSYTYDECLSLPHKTITEGNTTYHIPCSLLSSGYSGLSDVRCQASDSEIVMLYEIYNKERAAKIGPTLYGEFQQNLMDTILSLLPGGKRIQSQFDYYSSSAGPAVMGSSFCQISLGDHTISQELQVGDLALTYPMPGDGITQPMGEILYPYPQTVGEAAVNLAYSRRNWQYSQAKRMQDGYWDCSSMIARCYAECGVDIPPSASTMTFKYLAYKNGQIISEAEMQAGDVYWMQGSGDNRHVVMYAGNGMVIHASSPGRGTVYEPLAKWRSGTRKKLVFCFRPYRNLSSTWKPEPVYSVSGVKTSDFLVMTKEEAVRSCLEIAVLDSRESGILPSVTAAQMIQESSKDGKVGCSGLTQKANNFFGIKDGRKYPGSPWSGETITMRTREERADGTSYYVDAKFRKYRSLDESVRDHSCYLLSAKKGDGLRYAGLTAAKTPREAAEIIYRGGYATDRSYADDLCRLIEKYNLDRYDGIVK